MTALASFYRALHSHSISSLLAAVRIAAASLAGFDSCFYLHVRTSVSLVNSVSPAVHGPRP